jgi:glucose/arabinose dehydrogenase
VETEGLEGSGDGEEENCRREEDAEVEMDLTSELEELVGRGHRNWY